MKKILLLFLMSSMFFAVANAETLDKSDWYVYNGYTTTHSFSVKFPSDWQSKTYGDDMQGFAPKTVNEDSYFLIQEFEGKTYDQVINSYLGDNTTLVKVEDLIFGGDNDLVAKEAIYLNKSENKQLSRTLIKRGGVIIVLSGRNMDGVADFPVPEEYKDITESIYSSFKFTDDWHQYIDFENKYTFIFPSALILSNLSDGVVLLDPEDEEIIVFSIFEYANTSLEDAPDKAEGYGESLSDTVETSFHGIENALSATYYSSEEKKEFKRIFVEKNDKSYAISDKNIETNFPRMDYFNKYVIEMVESFEFFGATKSYNSFKYFPDVPDDHLNKAAINYLKSKDVIAGYPDGTFKPDGEINRAELTKMIVATKDEPDAKTYNNCFPDVKDQWFAPYICYAKEQKWIDGYSDGTFKPEQKINRAEALKILLEVLYESLDENEELEDKTVRDVAVDDWYGKYFVFADNRDLLDKQHIAETDDGYSYFPDKNITRKEVAETIYRILKKLPLTFL